jgi:hypothetical protein
MSKQPNRHGPQKRRPQQRKGRTAIAAKSGRANRITWLLVGGVLVVGIALIAAFASSKKDAGAGDFIAGERPADAALVTKVSEVPEDVINEVGVGSITGLPSKLPGPILKSSDGKPRIIYIGSNYCPFCATERWGMVNALSRFGTFTDLKETSSAKNTPSGAPEVHPGTGTFSFHGSSYESDYVQFEPVEQFGNEVEGNSFKPLDQATPEQDAINARYNKEGSIPFISFANEYMISGASFDPGVLKDKTRLEIADELSNASSDVTQGVVGTANAMTATICKLTENKPANVCTNDTIQAIQAQLPS